MAGMRYSTEREESKRAVEQEQVVIQLRKVKCRPTMQCIGPAGCSRLLLEVKVAPTHRSADRRRWATRES